MKLVNFKLFNQYFYIALNPFFDAGYITKQYRNNVLNEVKYDPELLSLMDNPEFAKSHVNYDAKIYDPNMSKFIYSAGAGLKIAMNQNFIISAEFAKCFYKPLDAGLWIGIGINYQF